MSQSMTPSVSTPATSTAATFSKLQSCDRCRLKKIKCSFSSDKALNGKNLTNSKSSTLSQDLSSTTTTTATPTVAGEAVLQCKQCFAVGFDCKITDKLSRKSFPRGYTETLEERVRQLEVENMRLSSLCETIQSQHSPSPQLQHNNTIKYQSSNNTDSKTNTSLGSRDAYQDNNNGNEDKRLHEIPVGASNSSYDPTAISFEPNKAPGLPAAKILKDISKHESSVQLAILVALAVPRSTEEVLFTPQLIAKIGKVYGLSSKQCLYTASLLASLKENFELPVSNSEDDLSGSSSSSSSSSSKLADENLWDIEDVYEFFTKVLRLDFSRSGDRRPKEKTTDNADMVLTIQDIRGYADSFFNEWAHVVPILNADSFYEHLNKFENDLVFFNKKSGDGGYKSKQDLPKSTTLSYKIFTCLLVVIVQMGILSVLKNRCDKDDLDEKLAKSKDGSNADDENNGQGSTRKDKKYKEGRKLVQLSEHYHSVLKQLVLNPYFIAKTTSIPSLQFLTISLYYFTNIGDVSIIYDLKGKVCLMSQQLRLHRCPSVVLGANGSKLDSIQQRNRRYLFWAIYALDCFSSYQLGIPRLFKDQDVECALPFSNDEKAQSFSGKEFMSSRDLKQDITSFSLNVIRFSQVLGNVLDTIYKRHMSVDAKNVILLHEQALENWRRGLPQYLSFQIDVNGEINNLDYSTETVDQPFHKEKKMLMILYCICKCVIHLPIVAIKNLDAEDTSATATTTSSYVILQQSADTLLKLLYFFKELHLPLPLMYSNMIVHFSLICVRRALEFRKSGILFGDIKNIIMDHCTGLLNKRILGIPGSLSWYSMKLYDICMQILLIPSPPVKKKPTTDVDNKLDKMLTKITTMYSKLMGEDSTINNYDSNCKKELKRLKDRKRNITATREEIKHENTSDTLKTLHNILNDKKVSFNCNNENEEDEEEEEEEEGVIMMKRKKPSISGGSGEPLNHSLYVPSLASSMQPSHAATTGETSHSNNNNKWSNNVNAISEAFQMDPVLSIGDFKDFFSTKDKNSQIDSGIANNFNNPNISQSGINGLFNVPSNGNFLKEFMRPSTFNFNDLIDSSSTTTTTNNNNNNGTQKKKNTTQDGVSNISSTDWFQSGNNGNYNNYSNNGNNYNGGSGGNGNSIFNASLNNLMFTVDASLGLAPLLDFNTDFLTPPPTIPPQITSTLPPPSTTTNIPKSRHTSIDNSSDSNNIKNKHVTQKGQEKRDASNTTTSTYKDTTTTTSSTSTTRNNISDLFGP